MSSTRGWNNLLSSLGYVYDVFTFDDRLMHEPRGHKDMYGAIIVRETEMTREGEADVGVLFMHNGGYPARFASNSNFLA